MRKKRGSKRETVRNGVLTVDKRRKQESEPHGVTIYLAIYCHTHSPGSPRISYYMMHAACCFLHFRQQLNLQVWIQPMVHITCYSTQQGIKDDGAIPRGGCQTEYSIGDAETSTAYHADALTKNRRLSCTPNFSSHARGCGGLGGLKEDLGRDQATMGAGSYPHPLALRFQDTRQKAFSTTGAFPIYAHPTRSDATSSPRQIETTRSSELEPASSHT